MGIHTTPLFPTKEDLCSEKPRQMPTPIRQRGPYWTYNSLLQTHIDLLSEDYIRGLREQVDRIRDNPTNPDRGFCYNVTLRSDKSGVAVIFDPEGYEWEQEKRLMFGNLVFFTKNVMRDYIVGRITESSLEMRQKGSIVVELLEGIELLINGKVMRHKLNTNPSLNHEYTMVESRHFFFPYLHVTNTLRRDKSIKQEFILKREIVEGRCRNDRVKYLSRNLRSSEASEIKTALQNIRNELNTSQTDALDKVLSNRVALVQGPPGTGKTHLGCKVAEYLVHVKKTCPNLLPGPIFVVTSSNHAVQEFLKRCLKFTEKVIHGYSESHDREVYGSFQEKYNGKMLYEQRQKLMGQADILAMTTTRAAYTRPALDKLQIKVVIVEEAARAQEGFVLASIPRDTEHLILLGDQKQLRPICANDRIARDGHLDLSLFQRLINNGVECPMLNEQRRMRPEIADLIKGIYPTLTDHPSTLNRASVEGIDLEVPLFFLNHTMPEEQCNPGFCNPREAKMAVELCHYLLLQGHKLDDVTILTTYRRQLSLIAKHIRQIRGTAEGVRISTVDAFQGEESRVVILSLVRSNPEGYLGFVKFQNRACVALSRARDGFIILGNMKCISDAESPVWERVISLTSGKNRLGSALSLLCIHGKAAVVECAVDVRDAGCAICKLYAALNRALLMFEMALGMLQETKAKLNELRADVLSESDRKLLLTLEVRCKKFRNEVTLWKNKSFDAFEAWSGANSRFEQQQQQCASLKIIDRQRVVSKDLLTKLNMQLREENLSVGSFGHIPGPSSRGKVLSTLQETGLQAHTIPPVSNDRNPRVFEWRREMMQALGLAAILSFVCNTLLGNI